MQDDKYLHNFNALEERKDLIKRYAEDSTCRLVCQMAFEMMKVRPDTYKYLMESIRDGYDQAYDFDKTTRAMLINDNEALRNNAVVRHYIAAAMGEKLGKHIELEPIGKKTKRK